MYIRDITMDIVKLKMVLDDEIVSIHYCYARGFLYIIHKIDGLYLLSFYVISREDILSVLCLSYKHLSSARRRANQFYENYREISKEELDEILEENKIFIKKVLTPNNIVL